MGDSMNTTDSPPAGSSKGGAGKWLAFVARWSIAIVGISWVLGQLTIRDRVYVLDTNEAGQQVVWDVAVEEPFDPETDDEVVVESYVTGEPETVEASRLIHGPDQKSVELAGGVFELAGMRLAEEVDGQTRATTIYTFTTKTGDGYAVDAADVSAGPLVYEPQPPQPLVRTGLANMVRDANPCCWPWLSSSSRSRWSARPSDGGD